MSDIEDREVISIVAVVDQHQEDRERQQQRQQLEERRLSVDIKDISRLKRIVVDLEKKLKSR